MEAEAAQRREENERLAAEERVQEQKKQAERDRIQRHAAKLAEIVDARRENLFHAAQTWLDGESLYVFIDACEQRWRKAGELAPEKIEWLVWAREEAAKVHPFTKGYPDPIEDGRFDLNSVPMGGPYPKVKALRQKKPPEPVPAEVRTVYVREPQQYQYWLRNRSY